MAQYTDDLHSLSHTKWNCKYHIVFAPKYRRKAIYDARRQEIGARLRQLCDWGVFLERKRGSIDRTKLKQIIDEMDMVRAWQDFGELLVVYLGMNPQCLPYRNENISSRRLDIIMERILSEGNFGFERSYFKKRSENYLLNKVVSLFRHMARFLQLFRLYPVSAYWYMMYFMRNAMSKFLKLK